MKSKMKRAAGGSTEDKGWAAKDDAPKTVYAGGDSNVVKEAKEKKHGGKVKRKHGGKIEGDAMKHRLDRRGRKTGGRVGSDKMPLSAAARLADRPGGKLDAIDD